jgi:hypothetical protein
LPVSDAAFGNLVARVAALEDRCTQIEADAAAHNALYIHPGANEGMKHVARALVGDYPLSTATDNPFENLAVTLETRRG